MKNIINTLILLTLFQITSFAENVIAKVGEEKITFEQLKKAYEKNLQPGDKTLNELPKDSVMSFLDLYVKYRLKVLDAIDKGYLQDSSVKEELKTNRRLLAESFYFENELMKPKIQDIIERRKNEYRFAFIILPFSEMNEEHQESRRKEAKAILDSIQKGMPFGEAAVKFSEDARTQQDGGKVDTWVTGGAIQKPLEDVFFSLKPGEVHDDIIETSYGCFIVKLLEREKRKLVDASHILVEKNSEVNTKEDTTRVMAKADSLINLLNNGADFKEIARKHSKDRITGAKGGSFGGTYSRSTGFDGKSQPLYPTISEKLWNMNEGEISELVSSPLGFHILKVDKISEIDKEKEYDAAKKVYKRLYYDKDKEIFMDSVAKHFGFEIVDKNIELFQSELDTNKTTVGENWADDVSTNSKDKVLFKFNDKDYTIGEFINKAISNRKLRGYPLTDSGIENIARKIIDDQLFDLATVGLEDRFEEYKKLLEEFRDGIILFKAEDEEVWSKKKFDEKIAKAYYDSTKSNYMTNYRFDVSEIYRLNESSIKEIKEKLDNGEDFEEIAELKTQRDGYREKKGYLGWIEKGKDNTADVIPIEEAEKGALIGPVKNKFGWSLIKIHDLEEPRIMNYEEAKMYISPDVQNIVQDNLRKAWLSEIRKKHPVKIYEDKLEKLISKQ